MAFSVFISMGVVFSESLKVFSTYEGLRAFIIFYEYFGLWIIVKILTIFFCWVLGNYTNLQGLL